MGLCGVAGFVPQGKTGHRGVGNEDKVSKM